MKKIIISIVVIAIMLLSINFTKKETITLEPEPSSIKTKDKLDVWIDKASEIEYGHKKEFRILDSNNRYSYGCMRFQADTFVEESMKNKMYGDISDCEFQKSLAKTMILKNNKDWRHWYNTTKKIGKPPLAQK
jgi:thioredoxin-related protein